MPHHQRDFSISSPNSQITWRSIKWILILALGSWLLKLPGSWTTKPSHHFYLTFSTFLPDLGTVMALGTAVDLSWRSTNSNRTARWQPNSYSNNDREMHCCLQQPCDQGSTDYGVWSSSTTIMLLRNNWCRCKLQKITRSQLYNFKSSIDDHWPHCATHNIYVSRA